MNLTRESDAGAPAAARRPRLLFSTGPLLSRPLPWALEAIAEAGFDGAELLVAHPPDTQDPERARDAAERAGLPIEVVHGPYMVVLRRVLGADYERKTRRSLEIAAGVGASTMVAHAPMRWERRARRWSLHEAPAAAADLGPRFAMENLFPYVGRSVSSVITPDDLEGYAHVTLDTSHLAVSGIDLGEAWDRLSDRIAHVHLSDNRGRGRDDHAPLGSGVLDLERLAERMAATGYAGTVTLELDARAYLGSRRDLVAYLARERLKAERLLEAGRRAAGAAGAAGVGAGGGPTGPARAGGVSPGRAPRG